MIVIPPELVVKAAAELLGVGIERALDDHSDVQTVDLSPVVSAIDGLQRTSESLLSAVVNPLWVAGDERCRMAIIAFSHGWFDDALRDAEASIEFFPYRALPRLVGGLSALAVGDAPVMLTLLDSAIKYGVDGEEPYGVMAGLVLATVAQLVGARERVRELLDRCDTLTAGRSLDILEAKASLNGWSDNEEDAAIQLWWDARHGNERPGDRSFRLLAPFLSRLADDAKQRQRRQLGAARRVSRHPLANHEHGHHERLQHGNSRA